MALRDKISSELRRAMKSGDTVLIETLRSIRAQIIEFEKRGEGTDMSEDQELALLYSAAKKRKEAMELYERGGRPDLFEREKKELEIIQEYLPGKASDEEIRSMIRKHMTETGAAGMKDFGRVMPLVMKQLRGRADGADVQRLVRECLES